MVNLFWVVVCSGGFILGGGEWWWVLARFIIARNPIFLYTKQFCSL